MLSQRHIGRVVLVLLILFLWLQYRLIQIHFQPLQERDSLSSNNRTTKRHPICAKIPSGVSATSIWKRHQSVLLDALIHPRDVDGFHRHQTKQLLELITPSLLTKSLRSFPAMNHPTLDKLFTKLHEKMLHSFLSGKSASTSEAPPPVKIFVFGGSVVEGNGCSRGSNKSIQYRTFQDCAWPFRLQHFLHTIFLRLKEHGKENERLEFDDMPQIVQVDNLGAGGTHSEAAIPVLDYWLSPVYNDGIPPDIVVNAYSANDNLPPAFHATQNTTIDNFHLYRILKRNQEFVRAAKQTSASCSGKASSPDVAATPLILYVNDYVGNQQESIWGEGQVDEIIQWMADLDPSIGYVSPAHMVKRWVLADTTENKFSGDWIDRKTGNYSINVHYGMIGHITTMLAVAFHLLQLLLDFCEVNEELMRIEQQREDCGVALAAPGQLPLFDGMSSSDMVQIDLPSKEWVETHQPRVIVPKIVERSWTNTSGRKQGKDPCEDASNQNSGGGSPCTFAFLAAPLGTHKQERKLAEFLRPFTILQDGWEIQDDFRHGAFQNKLGLVATRPSANMTLGFHHISKPVRAVTIHYLKSYSPEWIDSRTRFTLEVFWHQKIIQTHSLVLEGFHNQNVSISYVSRSVLEREAPIGSSIRFQLQLITGKTFKVNAMMLCRY